MNDAPPAPAEGSSLYYAMWGLDETLGSRVLAHLALGTALNEATLDVRESDVARRKIHWWHEELDRLHAGAPRHPATLACAELQGSDAAREQALSVLGAAAEERLQPSATLAAQDARLTRAAGARLALVLQALQPSALEGDGAPASAWSTLALGLALHERLATLAALLSRGNPVFASELYARHDASPADLGAGEGESAARAAALLRDALDHARDTLAHGIEAVAPSLGRGSPVRVPLTLARLRLKQLDLWRSREPDLVRDRPSVLPIVKLWLAWRTR